MTIVVISFVILICLFVSVVNYHFQKNKYKYHTAEAMKEISFFETPSTWTVFSIIFALLLIGSFAISIGLMSNGLSGMENEKNSVKQYQEDLSNFNVDTE